MIEDNPDNIEAFILKAKTYWSNDKIIEGNEFMWKAFLLDQGHPEIKEFLSYIRPKIQKVIDDSSINILEGKYKEALNHLKKGIEIHSNNFDINLLRSNVYRKLKNFNGSLNSLETLSVYLKELLANDVEQELQEERQDQLNKHFSYTYNEMGQLLFEKKEYMQAATLFIESDKFNHGNIGILCNLGDCYVKVKDLQEAEKHYRKAEQLMIKNIKTVNSGEKKAVRSRLGNLFYQQAKIMFNATMYKRALDIIKKALKSHITKDKLYLKGKIYLQLQQNDQAMFTYREILNKDPKDYVALQFMNLFDTRNQ